MTWKDFLARIRGMQKACIYLMDSDDPLIIIWTCSAPVVGETIIIWDAGKFIKYQIQLRIWGVNVPSKTACWNIYVKEIE